jgi:hypothetical protein
MTWEVPSRHRRFYHYSRRPSGNPERRPVATPPVLPFQESLELCSNYTIKDAFFGITRDVDGGGFADIQTQLEGHAIAKGNCPGAECSPQ